jgi:hypothetical protein
LPNARDQLIIARDVFGGERPTIPDSISAPYAELMRRCWATTPGDRLHFNEIAY